MKIAVLLSFGIVLIFAAIAIRFESYSWACVIPIDPSMTTSKTPVFALDPDIQKAYNFASEVFAALGVALTTIAALRGTKVSS